MPDEWLSLQQIAGEIGVPLASLYNQRSRGVGPRGYRIGRHIRVRRSDLNEWLEKQRDAQGAAQ